MKNKYLVLYYISFLCCLIFAMENEKQQVPHIQLSLITDTKSVVETINTAINTTYQTMNSYDDMLSLLVLVDTYCSNPRAPLISMLNDLYKKNSFFAQAINYFTQLGYSNIENSTVQTLDIVNDYTAQQPTEQLNTLPLIIKQYITLCAWNNIKASYTIQLHHPQPVYIYSLCPASGNIIVHSTDKHLHLWNCNTGEKIDTFSEDNYLLAICFNNNGSKFATTSYKNNKSLIKIWNIAPKKILSTFSQDNYVYHLEFLTDTSNDTLTTFIKTDNEKFLQLYNCDHHMKPICLGKIPSIKRSTCCDTYDSYKNYEINVCEDNRSILFFTKKRCPELHLCERAIMNGVQTDASFVYRTNTYSRLTKVEKQIVEEKIIKKNETLISSKKMTMTL